MKYRTSIKILWRAKTKICPSCGKRKSATHKYFGPNKKGRICWCRLCTYKHAKRWMRDNREKSKLRKRSWNLKNRYGMTLSEYESLCKAQNNACSICGLIKKLNIDHDHKTGKFRGLLCFECNAGLGNMKDNPDLLRAGASYLESRS